MSAFYNEFDPKAAAWLRWLIDEGLIPPGDVDERSIELVQPGDLAGYTHVHFFAGIGGWGYASLLAGWPADRPLWTGSCPCQPFSVAGKGLGADDPRHLWPHFFRLIRACRPPVVVGEQVAGAAGYGWFDGVAVDLGSEGYASRAVDIPAAAVDSPQIRQRLYWVAVADSDGSGPHAAPHPGLHRREESGRARHVDPSGLHGSSPVAGPDQPILRHLASAGQQPVDEQDGGTVLRGEPLVHPKSERRGEGLAQPVVRGGRDASASANASGGVALGDTERGGRDEPGIPEVGRECVAVPARTDGRAPVSAQGLTERAGLEGHAGHEPDGAGRSQPDGPVAPTDERNGTFWSGADWIQCHDGKARRVADAGTPLLAAGLPGRVVAWRGFGNAIVPQVAAEVLTTLMETT